MVQGTPDGSPDLRFRLGQFQDRNSAFHVVVVSFLALQYVIQGRQTVSTSDLNDLVILQEVDLKEHSCNYASLPL